MFNKNIILFIFVITIIFTAIQKTSAQKESVKHPGWSYNQTIYEVNLRQYTPEGTFKAFEKYLPQLKEMGVGIIWFMPIHPIGEKNRKGGLGSYYSVKDYKAVNPEYGTLEDFKSLVKKIHDMGMYVIIDWVANHSAWDNPLTETNPKFYTRDSSGNFVPPTADWWDVIDFNYKNKDLREYMFGAMKFWVTESDIDGFRCDIAGMVPMKFWNYVREELEKVKPVFMLAEWEGPEMHDKAFDMTYGGKIHRIMNEIAKGKKNAKHIVKYLQKEKAEYRKDAYRMIFTSNHDANSWNGSAIERMGDAAEVFAVLSATVKGMPLLYSGQEAGITKQLEFFDKDPIEWRDHKFRELYTKLFNLKKNCKALWNGANGGEMIRIKTNKSRNVFAFAREKEGDKVFVLLNLSDRSQRVSARDKNITGEYTELFTNERVKLSNKEKFRLRPWSYLVFVK